MSIYELVVLGGNDANLREQLSATITEMIDRFGMTVGNQLVIRTAADVNQRNLHSATVGVYFGHPAHPEADVAEELASRSIPTIPVVRHGIDFADHIPYFLQRFNGHRLREDDPKLVELASALLECLGLLRHQRRVFISYRRTESRAAALQLHDLMSARGFDVFLDTHDIRPGDPFQDVLWNRLCDSDVMVMLDTPTYFESRWTREEIGRARAKEIHVLRIVWPDHCPNKLTDLAETIYLELHELQAEDGPIVTATADQIALQTESLRSRSIASRFMSISGKLRADVERIGGKVEGIGAHRAVAIRLLDDRLLWAYPVVGIPTAATLNEVADRALSANHGGTPILVYDHIGISKVWSDHLRWLADNIKAVRAIKVSEAAWDLAAWEN